MSTDDRQLAIDHNRAQDRLSAAWNDGSPTGDLDAVARAWAWERAYAADVRRCGGSSGTSTTSSPPPSCCDAARRCAPHGAGRETTQETRR